MWTSVNTCALLVGLAAFAGWTLSRFSVPPCKGWFHRLGGVSILALSPSIASSEVVIGPGPDGVYGTSDDDTFQLQFIRPATPSVTISAHTKVPQRRSLTDLWVNAFVATGDPIPAPRTGRSFVADRPLERQTHFQAQISIHSPQLLLDVLAISFLYLVVRCPSSVCSGGISHCKSGFHHSGAITSVKRKSIWQQQESLYRKLLRPFAT